MPTYIFTSNDGQAMPWVGPYDNRPVAIRRSGKRYKFDFAATATAGTSSAPDLWRDFACEALAVDPSDAAEADSEAVLRGVPTEHDKTGRPHFTIRDHYRRYREVFGYKMHDGGFGDAENHERWKDFCDSDPMED